MKMFVGLVLFAAFALPAAFAAQQDVITLQAYEELLKNGAAYGMTKTVISNPVLEEALVSYSRDKLGGVDPCGETCELLPCYNPGCSCRFFLCVRNSLESTKSANPLLEEALTAGVTAFAEEGLGEKLRFWDCNQNCGQGKPCRDSRCFCTAFGSCIRDNPAM